MSWQTLGLAFAVAIAGGLGAVVRYAVDTLTPVWRTLKVSTLFINLSGSFLIGLVLGFTGRGLPGFWGIVLGVGFLGGYTTLSTASLQAAKLITERQFSIATLLAIVQLGGSILLTLLGFLLASAIPWVN